MNLNDMKKITIEGIAMKSISINGVEIWREPASYTNRIPTSINPDGSIYNGVGYKRGYRVRSGGGEAESLHTSCCGYIKVSPGDVVRIAGCEFDYANNGNAINVYDEDFGVIGQFTMLNATYGIFQNGAYVAYGPNSVVEEKSGVWKWIVPPAASGVAYIRLSCYKQGSSGPTDMVLTINEEITD